MAAMKPALQMYLDHCSHLPCTKCWWCSLRKSAAIHVPS